MADVQVSPVQWLNPIAWSGLALLVVPLAIHLLSRQPPRSDVFPSLRFLVASPLRPTRRARLSDWLLLCIRCAILIMAVAALAQPTWSRVNDADADRADTSPPASTVIIVDTTTMLAPAEDTLIVRRAAMDLRSALTEAVATLRAMPAPRALVVRSAFPVFSLDSVDLAQLPSDVHVTLESHSAREPRADEIGVRDTIAWITSLDSATASRVIRTVEAAGGDIVRTVSTASTRTVVVTTTDTSVRRKHLTTSAISNHAGAWSRLQAVAENKALAELVAAVSDVSPTATHTTPLHFTANGQPAVSGIARASQAVVVSHVPERPNSAAALLLAASSHAALQSRTALAPVGRNFVDIATLRRWSNAPAATAIGQGPAADMHAQHTFARVLWLAVLALLAVEHVVRTGRQKAQQQNVNAT